MDFYDIFNKKILILFASMCFFVKMKTRRNYFHCKNIYSKYFIYGKNWIDFVLYSQFKSRYMYTVCIYVSG